MIPYIILLISSVGGLFVIENYNGSSYHKLRILKIYMIAVAFVMVCLGGMRSVSVGADTSTYFEYFVSNFYYKIEVGYIALSRFVAHFNLPFNVLLLLIQSIVTLPIIYIIYKYSKIKWLSLFLYQAFYLYVNSFNILRQSIAMTIVLIAVTLLLHYSNPLRRNIGFILLILIAVLFHTSAIMLLVLLPLRNHTINIKSLLIVLVLSIIIMVFREGILTFLFSLINRGYYTEFPFDLGASSVAVFLLFLLLVTDGKNGFKGSNSRHKFIFNLLVYGLFFNIFWAWFPNHARITMYLFLILSVYLPNVLFEITDKKERIIKICVLVLFMLSLYGFQLVLRDYGKVVPYHFAELV